jgi:hypothetical protein
MYESPGFCYKCGGDRTFSDVYDSYYCQNCNMWLEDLCPDEDCGYCKNRPEKPLTHLMLRIRGIKKISNEIPDPKNILKIKEENQNG